MVPDHRRDDGANRVREQLGEIRGVRVLDSGSRQCAIVTASVEGHDARDIVKELSRLAINTTASLKWYGLLDLRGAAAWGEQRFAEAIHVRRVAIRGRRVDRAEHGNDHTIEGGHPLTGAAFGSANGVRLRSCRACRRATA